MADDMIKTHTKDNKTTLPIPKFFFSGRRLFLKIVFKEEDNRIHTVNRICKRRNCIYS
jgi:hypothetical protein